MCQRRQKPLWGNESSLGATKEQRAPVTRDCTGKNAVVVEGQSKAWGERKGVMRHLVTEVPQLQIKNMRLKRLSPQCRRPCRIGR